MKTGSFRAVSGLPRVNLNQRPHSIIEICPRNTHTNVCIRGTLDVWMDGVRMLRSLILQQKRIGQCLPTQGQI